MLEILFAQYCSQCVKCAVADGAVHSGYGIHSKPRLRKPIRVWVEWAQRDQIKVDCGNTDREWHRSLKRRLSHQPTLSYTEL